MQLYLNDTSPFARFVLVTALEFGIENIVLNWVDPWASPDTLTSVNPFSTVPALKPENGPIILESLLICQYLYEQSKGKSPSCDVIDLHRLSIGKTLMELSFRNVILQRFVPQPTHCELFIRSKSGINRTLASLDELLPYPPSIHSENITIADICLALSVSYIRFRLPELLDGITQHTLLEYLDEWERRPSFKLTSPQALKAKPQDLLALRSGS